MIGGTTAFDDNKAALTAIMAEWTSARDRATRIANLTDGSGSIDGANDPFFLLLGAGGTVFDDATSDILISGLND